MSPLYPNVPLTAGVPPVFRRGPTAPDIGVPALSRDALSGGARGRAVWGIYDKGGRLVLQPDSIVAAELTREFRVSDYPVEQGGFRSYNKVATPAETRVTLSKGGNEARREAFLIELDKIIASTDLYSFVTPDGTYLSRNAVRYDFARSSENGATLLTVELTLQEIRVTAAAAFSATRGQVASGTAPKSASGADPVTVGPVQPARPPSPAPTPVLTPAA